MSSIYEALKRSQAQQGSVACAGAVQQAIRPRVVGIVATAVVVSSVVTAVAIYLFAGPPGVQKDQASITAQENAGDASRILELMATAERLRLKGELEPALNAYREVIRQAPGYTEAYLRSGEVCYLLKRFDEAEDVLAAGLKLRPQDARLLNNMGSVLLAKGKAAESLTYFVQARRSSSDYVEPLYNMACAYARMNRKEAALSSLRQACEMQPEVRLWAVRDPDLAVLAGEKEFKAIVQPGQ